MFAALPTDATDCEGGVPLDIEGVVTVKLRKDLESAFLGIDVELQAAKGCDDPVAVDAVPMMPVIARLIHELPGDMPVWSSFPVAPQVGEQLLERHGVVGDGPIG